MSSELQKRLLSSIILIPLSIFFIIKGNIFLIFFLTILFLITSYEWFKLSKKNNLLKICGIFFLVITFTSAYRLRENLGLDFFLFIILISISTDVGGYFFGKSFKGPKLTKISPNKTYAGVIGSFIFSLLAGHAYIKFLSNNLLEFKYTFVLLLILFISLISQIGDLIISYFKRKAKLKDTGKLLPGHGGILDRIDGLIFVVPIIYILSLVK